ncbi:endoglucanase [Fibrobacteria bacterium R8-3-H12]
MFKKIAAILAFAALLAYSAVNFPYPQRRNYGNGTINAVNSTADADLKARFKAFYNNFYVENGSQARIKFDEPENTVSEGIGYAMIMMVYFSDATKSYEDEFKKLWAYYNAHKNGNGVMNWKISGFGNAIEQNGATDAELDVALALAMARYQFNDTKYETEAKSLIKIIWDKEMENDGLHKPGDAWNADRNPSYVSPAAFEIFRGLDNDANWSKAITRNYTFLKANQNGTSGLPSNWASDNGAMKECSYCGYSSQNYGQDAVRAPWRWAWSKAWYGHADAETLLAKLASWVNGKNPSDIKGPINVNGTMGTVPNAGYLGSLMCALTHKNTYQSKLNTYWSSWATITGDTYFNSAMQILTGLLVSGNMPNLKACAAGNCGTDMTKPGDYKGSYTQLDKLAFAGSENIDARSYAVTGEPWFAYTDAKAGYENGAAANGQAKSSITNEKFTSKDENNNCQEAQSYRVVLSSNGSNSCPSNTPNCDWSVQIKSYTLDAGTYKYDPFVALGLDARNNGKATSAGGYDISKCTAGFSYEYKGSAHKFKVLNKQIADGVGSDHFKLIGEGKSVAADWTPVVVPTDELAQPSWVTTNKIDFKLVDVKGWAWELVGDYKDDKGKDVVGHSPMTGSFALRNFRCLGDMPVPASTGTSKCGTDIGGSGSSSSRGSSSSVSGSGGSSSSRGSSSSVSGSGGSSSSRGSSSVSGSGSSSSRGSSSVSGSGSSSSRSGGGSSSNSNGGGSSSDSNGGGSSSDSNVGSSSSNESTPIISLSQYAANNGAFVIKNGVNLQVSKTANVEVFGLNGKFIRKHEFSNGSYSLMLGDLPKGLYIIKVQFGSQEEILHVPVR